MSRKKKKRAKAPKGSDLVVVREATEDDIAVIIPMAKSAYGNGASEVLGEFDADAVSQFVANLIANPKDSAILLARINGVPVGMLALFLMPSFLSPATVMGQEFSLWVDPEHRTHGVGSSLLMAAESWASDRAAKVLNVVAMRDQGDLARRFLVSGYRLLQSTYTRRL